MRHRPGEPVARVHPDGTVASVKTGQPLPLTVTADRVTLTGRDAQRSIALAADGSMTIAGGSAKPARLPRAEGATTPGKRRAVLALLGLLFSGEQRVESRPLNGTTIAPSAPPP